MAIESTALTEKQRQILAYLREHVDDTRYFKSRRIGQELDLSAKEVGRNLTDIIEHETDLAIEKWGYSSATTWKVTPDKPDRPSSTTEDHQ